MADDDNNNDEEDEDEDGDGVSQRKVVVISTQSGRNRAE